MYVNKLLKLIICLCIITITNNILYNNMNILWQCIIYLGTSFDLHTIKQIFAYKNKLCVVNFNT